MALLAVFDTQVLAIFRRRKEMGTLMALGMTRWDIISLFTLEGSLLGILAFCSRIIIWTAPNGISRKNRFRNAGHDAGCRINYSPNPLSKIWIAPLHCYNNNIIRFGYYSKLSANKKNY